MRLQIRYFRPMVYGNYTTFTFDDINFEETFVSQLKRKIFIRMRIEPKHQKITVRNCDTNEMIELTGDNTLSAYQIQESTPIILENLSRTAQSAHVHDEEFKCQVDVSHSQQSNTLLVLIGRHGKHKKNDATWAQSQVPAETWHHTEAT